MGSAIEVRNLTKDFRRHRAVDNLSFEVESGSVTGFLGPNGAGKTTTLRMLLGLVVPTSGTATLERKHYRELSDSARRVGAIIEGADSIPDGRLVPICRRTRSPPAHELAPLLAEKGIAAEMTQQDELTATGTTTDAVGEIAGGGGIVLHELCADHTSLEDVFLELTSDHAGRKGSGDVAAAAV